MNRLSPRTTVLSGATIGLIAGAAIFGAVSSSANTKAPTAFKPALVSADTAPALTAANCAAGQELEHGVCIVHVEKVVVIPAPASVQAEAPVSGPSQDISSAEDQAMEPSDDAMEPSDDAMEATEDSAEEATHDAAEHAAEVPTESDS